MRRRSTADGASIQQTLKLLEEKLKSVDVGLQGLREKGQGLLDQISNQASWAYGKDVTIENKENVDHIQGVMEDMQLRKQRQSLNVTHKFYEDNMTTVNYSIFCKLKSLTYYMLCIE